METPVTDGNGEGVALVFQVTDKADYVPYSLPECNNYMPPVKKLPKHTKEGKNKGIILNEEPQEERNVEINIEEYAKKRSKASSSNKYSEDESNNGVEGHPVEKEDGEITYAQPLPLPPGTPGRK